MTAAGLVDVVVAQRVEQVIHLSGRWFDPQSVLGQDAEPQIAPDGCSISVCICC